MRRLLFIAAIVLSFFQWRHYSDPGNYPKEKIEAIESVIPLDTVLDMPRYPEKPTLVRCKVISAFGFRHIGYCIIQQNGRALLVLTRGFPPPLHKTVQAVIIPRRCLQVGDRYLVVAAMVATKEVKAKATSY